MVVRTNGPSVRRSVESELDQRVIRVVGHLLTTGIWLEHRLRNTPTPWTGLVAKSGRVRPPRGPSRSVDLPLTQPTRKQPSRTADFAVGSR